MIVDNAESSPLGKYIGSRDDGHHRNFRLDGGANVTIVRYRKAQGQGQEIEWYGGGVSLYEFCMHA